MEIVKEQARDFRKKHFAVKVYRLEQQYLFDDEMTVDVTHNGRQWMHIQCNTEELLEVYEQIKEYLYWVGELEPVECDLVVD